MDVDLNMAGRGCFTGLVFGLADVMPAVLGEGLSYGQLCRCAVILDVALDGLLEDAS